MGCAVGEYAGVREAGTFGVAESAVEMSFLIVCIIILYFSLNSLLSTLQCISYNDHIICVVKHYEGQSKGSDDISFVIHFI